MNAEKDFNVTWNYLGDNQHQCISILLCCTPIVYDNKFSNRMSSNNVKRIIKGNFKLYFEFVCILVAVILWNFECTFKN